MFSQDYNNVFVCAAGILQDIRYKIVFRITYCHVECTAVSNHLNRNKVIFRVRHVSILVVLFKTRKHLD